MVLSPDIPVIVLQLPIIISLIAFIRYVIGYKTWKNYPTIALTLAFFLMNQATTNTFLTLSYWVIAVLVIIATAIGTRSLIRKLKINHYARVAIMYLAATTVGLILIALALQTSARSVVSQPTFGLGLFLIGTTIDELATLLFKKDMQEFIRRFVSTFAIALFSGLLITWGWWNSVLSRHHELLVLVLVIDTVISFWTAFRLTELARFGSIIKGQK